jgi:hypothetical protein
MSDTNIFYPKWHLTNGLGLLSSTLNIGFKGCRGRFRIVWGSELFVSVRHLIHIRISILQGDSLARGPKLLSIKNYVIEIMT